MIDVNGTRHHLLLGPADWRRCTSPTSPPDWLYDEAEHVVTLAPRIFRFPQPAGDPVLAVSDRRGAARDPYGHWYWIDADGLAIRVRWSEAQAAEHYWAATDRRSCQTESAGPFAPAEPPAAQTPEPLAGLAVTTGHYLVVGSPTSDSLLVFDLHTGGAPPMRVPLPVLPGAPLTIVGEAFDLAPLSDGGLVVLDRRHKRIWLLDATFRPAPLPTLAPGDALLFQPVAGPPRVETSSGTPTPITLTDAVEPISVEPLPDGTLLILDRADALFATVRRYDRSGGPALGSVPLLEAELRGADEPALQLERILGHDMAFVAQPGDPHGPGTLYVVDAGGNQVFALTVTSANGLTLRAQRAYYPLRGYTGKALVAPPGEAHPFFDQRDRWLPVVSLQRPRYAATATLDLPTLDGRDPGCVWHRLCLDACIPPETAVRVLTRAADQPDLLAWQPWTEEPQPYLRGDGAELPYYRLWSETALERPDVGTWELLFQRARGRYLDIRLELSGNGRNTPRLRAVRAHYPRFSYLRQYLPAVYGEDSTSASFLERFLSNPEGLLTTLEGQIADAQIYWDVRTTPTEALEWLAGWLGLALDPAWSEYQRRLLIAYAPVFFLRRGTLTGLVQAIRLAIDVDVGPEIFQGEYDDRASPVRIVERFRTRRMAGVAVGVPDEQDGPSGSVIAVARARAHRFIVLLPDCVSAEQVALVERLVQLEQPAHTQVTVKRYWAMFRVGEARLGLDTRLGEGGRFELFRLGSTALAEGTLGAAYPFNLTDRTILAS